jgi:hypothetical protein
MRPQMTNHNAFIVPWMSAMSPGATVGTARVPGS